LDYSLLIYLYSPFPFSFLPFDPPFISRCRLFFLKIHSPFALGFPSSLSWYFRTRYLWEEKTIPGIELEQCIESSQPCPRKCKFLKLESTSFLGPPPSPENYSTTELIPIRNLSLKKFGLCLFPVVVFTPPLQNTISCSLLPLQLYLSFFFITILISKIRPVLLIHSLTFTANFLTNRTCIVNV
jgi:hypothetical protein